MTGNMEAAGHGLYIDERSIETCMEALLGRSVPSYLTHSGAGTDRLGKEIAIASGAYREGARIRAKNLNFLDSFGKHDAPTKDKLVELARDYPDQLGISLVIAFEKVWVLSDGSEVDGDLPKPSNAIRGIPSIRINEVRSADLVQKPAANLGLFEAKVDPQTSNNTESMSADTILLSKHTEEVTSLQTQHKDAIAALETKHKDAVAALEKKVIDATAQIAQLQEKEKGLTASLAAKAAEAEEAAKYDMRKAGAPALQIALESHSEKIPAPAESDFKKWEQYSALCEAAKDDRGNVVGHKETPAAKRFRETYLVRK